MTTHPDNLTHIPDSELVRSALASEPWSIQPRSLIYQAANGDLLKVFPSRQDTKISDIPLSLLSEPTGLLQLRQRLQKTEVQLPFGTRIVDVDQQGIHQQGILMQEMQDLMQIQDRPVPSWQEYDPDDYSPENYTYLSTEMSHQLGSIIGRMHGRGIVTDPLQFRVSRHDGAPQLYHVFRRIAQTPIALDWTNLALVEWLGRDQADIHHTWLDAMHKDLTQEQAFSVFKNVSREALWDSYLPQFLTHCEDAELAEKHVARLKHGRMIWF
ncbi:MAG: hypothetical protein ACEQSA_00840 [Weeksellaceae bacterium]